LAELFTLKAPEDHKQIVRKVAFSPDGTQLATASWDRTVRIVDARTGKLLKALEGHIGPVNCAVFSPSGELLATGSGTGGVRLWDTNTGELHAQLAGHNFVVTDVAFSPDGKLLASCGHDNLVKIWDVASGRHLRTLIGHDDIVWEVAFAAAGAVVTASNDRTVRVWNADTGVIRTFKEHNDHVMAVATHPDPDLAYVTASGSEDGVVMLWDNRSGRELAPRRQVAGVILSLDFDPAGKRLAVGGGYSDRGEVRVWEIPEMKK
jgi:WD40 repeat protein